MKFFDAHLDLAYLAEQGRDMHAPLSDCKGPLHPPALTLPSMKDGNVRACLGTIFTEATKHASETPTSGAPSDGAFAYPIGDAEGAHRAGLRQLKLYQAWQGGGVIQLLSRRGRTHKVDPSGPLMLGILMECADPILDPDDLASWVEGGVVAVGMAWWHESRYAGGNGSDNAGLTDLGRALVPTMDELGVVHDASHLSQRSLDELFELTEAPVMASHSNCRALLAGDNHRHLSDESIREIARRGGVVGINLVRNFLDPTLSASPKPMKGDATIAQVCDHIEHVCAVVGDCEHVGLGSDMDGGITADDLPKGIDKPSDLTMITDALRERGWSDSEVRGFAHDNWADFWGLE